MGRRARSLQLFPLRHVLMSRAAALFAADLPGLTLDQLGAELGLCKAYWLQLSNGRFPVGRARRRAIAEHPAFAGIPSEQLWIPVDIPQDPSAITPLTTDVSP